MEQVPQLQMPRVKLGTQGLEVSKLGFGCMTLSERYNKPLPEEEGIAFLKYVFNQGITFFDTADVYGPYTNEILFAMQALKELPREKIQLATKFGVFPIKKGGKGLNGKPEYVRACCEASLKRLQVDYIDLYYQHRVDQTVPIEETIGELKKLVEEGKVKYIGLSEASPDTIRRAHAVHPISAVQMEWSLWSRDIEDEIVPLCRELEIGIVPYSPLGRGFFGGKGVLESVHEHIDPHPRFTSENLEKNKALYVRVENLAKKYECSTAQLALSWVLHQGDDVVPIPATTKIKNLDSNIGALQVKLTEDDWREISDLIPVEEVAGSRSYEFDESFGWKHANTPLPTSA
ncbi:probable aldo-keto reductase 1 isoform X2 [Dioscorea cayenensis subsp. rotundata]|uniref:Probable aldo-keto reductase 1 isoform X2 n=1 Tax=Dioscorea cayennensis subsp. rotundata TaxID=55577 RepID=A0AB40CQ09_DIOCR|nr:probable aldo-keto reductase 1 isoform X2 [Dioscorea cayenensis subsp. rotundata]